MSRFSHIARRFYVPVLLAVLFCAPFSDAAALLTAPIDNTTCTSSSAFDSNSSPGIVTSIATQVQDVLNSLAEEMFNRISSHSEFRAAVGAVITLYVAIYGILLAFGMAKETVYEVTMRIIKIVIVALLISGGAWGLFYTYVVVLFNTGVDTLINTVTDVAISSAMGIPAVGTGAPLGVLDNAINKAFSAKMVVHLFAMATTGMYGFFHALLAGIALYSLVGSFLLAIWIYLMSLVVRTLLFGLAPIFIAFLLFERTKPIFLGWVNQIISVCLQPVLLFTFLSFFLVLINGSIDKMLTRPVCWTELPDSERATPFVYRIPRFVIPDPAGGGSWVQFTGDHGWKGVEADNIPPDNEPFPVDILAILTFYLLTQLGRRFSEIVVLVAKDLASGSVNLMTMQGGLQEFFTPGDKIANASSVGERAGPPTGRSGPVTSEELSAAQRTGRNMMNAGRDVANRIGEMVKPRK